MIPKNPGPCFVPGGVRTPLNFQRHEGDARYLAYLDLDVKIGVARPDMVELGAQACGGKRWRSGEVSKFHSDERIVEEEMTQRSGCFLWRRKVLTRMRCSLDGLLQLIDSVGSSVVL